MAFPAVAAMIGQMAANQFQTDINRKLDRESSLELMEQQQEYNLLICLDEINRRNMRTLRSGRRTANRTTGNGRRRTGSSSRI